MEKDRFAYWAEYHRLHFFEKEAFLSVYRAHFIPCRAWYEAGVFFLAEMVPDPTPFIDPQWRDALNHLRMVCIHAGGRLPRSHHGECEQLEFYCTPQFFLPKDQNDVNAQIAYAMYRLFSEAPAREWAAFKKWLEPEEYESIAKFMPAPAMAEVL